MANVTLQRPYETQARGNSTITGPATGALYIVDGLGRVIVDATDAALLQVDGWLSPSGGGGGGPGSPLTLTDGTHTVNGVSNLAVTGGVVGGATPNATLTITGGGGGSLVVGTSPIAGGASGQYLYDNAGVLAETNLLQPARGVLVSAVDTSVYPYTSFATGGADFSATYDKITVDPAFSNVQALSANLTVTDGFNNYGTDPGGTFTGNKMTPIAVNIHGEYTGSGEHFALTISQNTYGMSDAFLFSMGMQYATGPIAGDEGQGFCANTYVQQLGSLPLATILGTVDGSINPVQKAVSAAATQAIVGSKDPQTITVTNVTNIAVNDWVVFNVPPPSGFPDTSNLICAAQIVGVNVAGTATPNIRCVVPIKYSAPPNAAVITGAMVLHCDNTQFFGQDRALINLSMPSYSVGKAYISGITVTGDGTGTWSPTMVGGIATSIGAFSFDADTYSNTPFANQPKVTSSTSTVLPASGSKTFALIAGGSTFFHVGDVVQVQRTSDPHNALINGSITSYSTSSMTITVTSSVGSGTFTDWTIVNRDPGIWQHGGYSTSGDLRSWYLIQKAGNVGLTSNQLVVQSTTVANFGYFGNAPTALPGTPYIIRPAARILKISTGFLVCETQGTLWNVHDVVECAICPYPDVHGFDFRMGQYTPGGTRRQAMGLWNNGARTFTSGLSVGTDHRGVSSQIGLPGSDTYAFDIGVYIDDTNRGIWYEVPPAGGQAAFYINNQIGSSADNATRILWNGLYSLGFNTTNSGLSGQMCNGGIAGGGRLSFIGPGFGINPYSLLQELEWQGYFRLTGITNSKDAFMEFGNINDPTGDRMQIAASLSNTGGAFPPFGRNALGGVGGFDILFATGSGTGTKTPIFTVSPGDSHSSVFDQIVSPYAVAAPNGQATSGANVVSAAIGAAASIWSGSAALLRPAIFYAAAEAAAGVSQLVMKLKMFDPAASYNRSNTMTTFASYEDGRVFFGYADAGSDKGVTFDPSATTAKRSVVWPNVSGNGAVVTSASSGFPTHTTAGTPGTVIVDSTSGNVYICYASALWTKLTGTLTF